MRALITGAAGFIGHHIVDHLLRETRWDLVLVDRLDTSGTLMRFQESEIFQESKHRCQFYWHDLKAPFSSQLIRRIVGLGGINYIFHIAAASHVDRSIEDPMAFVMDNVIGTVNMLELARNIEPQRFFYFSTDEVFGPAPVSVKYKEWDRYNSGNPYAASKAGAEEMCLAYHNTFKVPVVITHTMNVFGERQHPEKFIPNTLRKLMNGLLIQIHADPSCKIPGSRFYIHARNVAAALLFLMTRAKPGEKYNIVGEKEIDNLELVRMLSVYSDIPDYKYELINFHQARPGHDLRYALDGNLMDSIGWKLPVDFEDSLRWTIKWTLAHPQWM